MHPDLLADVQSLKSIYHLAFNRNIEKPAPCAFLGWAGDNRIKPLSDPGSKQERGRRIFDQFRNNLNCINLNSPKSTRMVAWYPQPVLISTTFSSPSCGSNTAVIRATRGGSEIV